MGENSHWHVVQTSTFPHEQEALDLLRDRLPERPPFRAWSNFEFIAHDGSINEVDVLVISTDCIYLVEIKAWSGEIRGNQNYWTINRGGNDWVQDNPLLLANRKAKKLKSLLEKQTAFKKLKVPFIQPVIFLSSTNCTLALDDVTSRHVHLRPDAKRDGQYSIVDVIAGEATAADNRAAIGRDVERAMARAMDQLGMRRRSSSAQVGDYKLTRLIEENDRFQDWEAVHKRVDSDRKRVRIFTHTQKAADAERQERKDMALREYKLLNNVHHNGILSPITLTECEVGPALVYELKPDASRLVHFMESRLPDVGIGDRLEIVREIAEALQYAHQQNVHHRALSPWTVDLRTASSRHLPVLRDWQSGISSADTRTHTRMTVHAGLQAGLMVDERASVYAAPEVMIGKGYDPIFIDIFALGAITYAIFSGQHPATDPSELFEKLQRGPGLRISDAMDGAPDSLQELVQMATDPDPAGRPASVQEFLKLLEQVEDDLTTPDEIRGVHPLDARKGDELSGGFTVTERLGSGSTCVALAVEYGDKSGVLKIAKDSSQNERVRQEAEVLSSLTHPNIVKCFGQFEIDGLAAIFIERAGQKTLDQRLRTEGRLSLDLLERFGDELLNVLVYLEREGINHRDIKPVNIGIGETRTRALTLKLYDFSLSRTPADNIQAGTPPYLDPFLRLRKPPRWDLYSERFAAAMTLYELATGTLPSWGDDTIDPLATDEEVRLDIELLDPALREALKDFFGKALAREIRKRFDNADEMHLAWRKVFLDIDPPATTEDTDTGEETWTLDLDAIEELGRTTRLAALGLSARELNAADRMGAATVGELLDLPNFRMYGNRGIGQRVVKHLRKVREQLLEHMNAEPGLLDEADESPEQLSIDRLVASLTGIKLPESELGVVRAWLGLDRSVDANRQISLPSLRDAAENTAIAREQARLSVERAVIKWTRNPWMTVLRDDIADFIQRREGIVTLAELAGRLLGLRGSVAEGASRMQQAIAVIQAALEAEAAREKARFILYRGSRSELIIATGQLGADFGGSTTERARYAENLAQTASRLAREEPLPSPRAVESALADIAPPDPERPMSAERRLKLAIAAAPDVALSSRHELYPVGMAAGRALRMGSNALLGPRRLTVAQLHSRIHSRFPQASPLPERPELDELLEEAEIPLEWQPANDSLPAGYAPPTRGSGLTHHTTTARRWTTTATLSGELGPEAQAAQRFENTLQRALTEQRVLIVNCDLSRLELAARELNRRAKLQPVSMDQLLIDAMRKQAQQAGADWRVVLQADSARQDSADWRRLKALVQRTMPAVKEQLQEHTSPLLIQHLGLLVRYGQAGIIQSLRDQASAGGKPARVILVPGSEHKPPVLDQVVLPIITPADWTFLPRAWLEDRHRQSA